MPYGFTELYLVLLVCVAPIGVYLVLTSFTALPSFFFLPSFRRFRRNVSLDSR